MIECTPVRVYLKKFFILTIYELGMCTKALIGANYLGSVVFATPHSCFTLNLNNVLDILVLKYPHELEKLENDDKK